MFFTIKINHDWANQIEAIRNQITEDTNLIRYDNTFYRICRNDPNVFFLTILPSSGRINTGITLTVRMDNFYITHIGSRYFERYASTLSTFSPNVFSLDQAIQDLPTLQGIELFEIQSMIVFCVAESLRSDYIATRIQQMISASLIGLHGVPVHLCIGEILPLARNWGRASEAIFDSLSSQAQQIALKARHTLSPMDRQFWERVDLHKIEPSLVQYAKEIKVIKRPRRS